MGRLACYHTHMTNMHHNHEDEHFPCDCHSPAYAYSDDPCPMCAERLEREREERRDAEDEERVEDPAEPVDDPEADNTAFADACGMMTQEDWDADNDWLASAGWGEM